jgi:hypothetical protein
VVNYYCQPDWNLGPGFREKGFPEIFPQLLILIASPSSGNRLPPLALRRAAPGAKCPPAVMIKQCCFRKYFGLVNSSGKDFGFFALSIGIKALPMNFGDGPQQVEYNNV